MSEDRRLVVLCGWLCLIVGLIMMLFGFVGLASAQWDQDNYKPLSEGSMGAPARLIVTPEERGGAADRMGFFMSCSQPGAGCFIKVNGTQVCTGSSLGPCVHEASYTRGEIVEVELNGPRWATYFVGGFNIRSEGEPYSNHWADQIDLVPSALTPALFIGAIRETFNIPLIRYLVAFCLAAIMGRWVLSMVWDIARHLMGIDSSESGRDTGLPGGVRGASGVSPSAYMDDARSDTGRPLKKS